MRKKQTPATQETPGINIHYMFTTLPVFSPSLLLFLSSSFLSQEKKKMVKREQKRKTMKIKQMGTTGEEEGGR